MSDTEEKKPEGVTAGDIADKLKEVKVSDDSSEANAPLGIEADLTEPQKKVLADLKALQSQHVALEVEFETELLALQAKYIIKYEPLYTQRAEKLTETVAEESAKSQGTPPLPKFWLTALQNNSKIADMIKPQDEHAMEFIKDIKMHWLKIDEQLSFEIIFEFAENPYFTNATLTKAIFLERSTENDGEHPNEDVLGDKILTGTEGTEIAWKDGKDLSKEIKTQTQRNKRTKEKRTVETVVDVDTFFNFFKTREIPKEEALSTMGRQQFEKLRNIVETEVDVACNIRDDIIPRAVSYFLGEVVSDDDDDDDDDYDSSEEE
eukprot:GHVN01079195.1.p1 GENE.GHVN01079195.1~~GHVN01079195.1.p1  ORF type:complete len:320 (-),score=71.31 GHVN01079195.1:141-1100(-)